MPSLNKYIHITAQDTPVDSIAHPILQTIYSISTEYLETRQKAVK